MKKIIVKNSATCGPWKVQLTFFQDAQDCRETVIGIELILSEIAVIVDLDHVLENKEEVDKKYAKIEDFRNRYKKAVSFITHTIDDTIVMSLEVHERDPVLGWSQLVDDYNTVTPARQSTARKEFLNFVIIEDETFLIIKQKIQ